LYIQAPNFAFSLITKRYLVAKEKGDVESITFDLSSLQFMGCGAEPIDPFVMQDFWRIFSRHGFPECVNLMYGLAEHTVYVCKAGTDMPMLCVNRLAFDVSEVEIIERFPKLIDARLEFSANLKYLVSCGKIEPPVDILIVDPADRHIVPDNKVQLSICR
jgi:hypothetical protein